MTNIKVIAKEAKVSIATVSRVLRNPSLVSESKRKLVLDAIEKFGYTPNSLGVGLRKSKTYKLVAIVPDVISNFNYPVIRAIESIAIENGYTLLLGDTQEMEMRERLFADMARSHQVDGILLFCSRLPFDVDWARPLADQLPPMVNACENIDLKELDRVNIDNAAAAEEAVNYLIELGHTRIAAITGNMTSPSSLARFEGYKRALSKAGYRYDEQLVEVADYSQQKAALATQKLAVLANRPTAIFNFSDEMAMSCMATLLKLGYRIPGDFSVVGFDNIGHSEYCFPALTTVSQPLTDIGIACMELLLPQLKGAKMQGVHRILPHQLVVRSSTGPAPMAVF